MIILKSNTRSIPFEHAQGERKMFYDCALKSHTVLQSSLHSWQQPATIRLQSVLPDFLVTAHSRIQCGLQEGHDIAHTSWQLILNESLLVFSLFPIASS